MDQRPALSPPMPPSVNNIQAMILAAGLGTRLKPWTDRHPKALAPVNGKPLLQHNIECLQRHGIFDVIVNVHHFAGQIREAIEINEGWGSNITISDESDAVLETGGGLQKAQWFFRPGDFVLMNVDVLTDLDLQQMLLFHQEQHPLATLAVRDRATSRYFLFDEQDILCGWRNVKTGEQVLAREEGRLIQKAFSGIHIIHTDIFPLLTRQGKFSMVDVYLQLARTHEIRAFDHSSDNFIDVGTPESIARAQLLFS